MKVWINKVAEPFGGGMIIVAANSAEDAHNIVMNTKCREYYKRMYYRSHWICLNGVTFSGSKPCILEEDSFVK